MQRAWGSPPQPREPHDRDVAHVLLAPGPQGPQGFQGPQGPIGLTGPPGSGLGIGAIIDYHGPLSNFDATGLGISGWLVGWALCNENNGTPDLGGKVTVGYHANKTDYNTIGKEGGDEFVQLGLNQVPAHDHNVSVNSNTTGISTGTAGSHTHKSRGNIRVDLGSGSGSDIVPDFDVNTGYTITNSAGNHTHSITDPGHGHSVNESSRGGGQSHENRMPYYVTAKIMKIA